MLKIVQISDGNRTEWSPIRSVIIRVINRIRRPHSGRGPICLITSMITDQIGQHKVLLPIKLIITLTKFVMYKALFIR